MLKLGMRGHDISCAGIEEAAAAAKAGGVEYIQLALRKTMGDIEWKNGMFSVGFAEYIRRTLDEANVRISVLGCYINLLDEGSALDTQTEMFREMLKFAKYCNAGAVGLESGFCGDAEKTHSEENYKKFVSRFAPLAAEAEKLGVMIAVEPVSIHTLYTPQRVKRFLDDLASPNVSVIYDAVNALTVQDAARQRSFMDECFEAYGEKIAFIHLKDFVLENGAKREVQAGTGEFDFGYLFSWIKKNKPHIDMILDGCADMQSLDMIRDALTQKWSL